jgi:hypothetical protein
MASCKILIKENPASFPTLTKQLKLAEGGANKKPSLSPNSNPKLCFGGRGASLLEEFVMSPSALHGRQALT